jgi:hypothetical protein
MGCYSGCYLITQHIICGFDFLLLVDALIANSAAGDIIVGHGGRVGCVVGLILPNQTFTPDQLYTDQPTLQT